MASKTDVMNRALSKLGDARITDPTEDSEAAILLNNMFDTLRDAELRANSWNFSIKRASLAALVTTPQDYSYEYQIPGDCLRVLMVGDTYPGYSLTNYRSMPESEYQIENKKILTNMGAPLKIRYAAQITNTGDWDPLFVEYFACCLAFEAAPKLANSNSDKQLLAEERRDALVRALRADAIENPPELIADDSWVLSRL